MSRTKRWHSAVEAAQKAASQLDSALDDLAEVWEEYEEWRNNLPENLEYSPVGEKLEAIVDNFDPNDSKNILEEITDQLSEAEQMDLPLGFGRD